MIFPAPEMRRIPITAAKRYGDDIDTIAEKIALKWPDGTIGVMYTKEAR